uniref:Uncharacterized protein n=1 Tax=Anguilla anguilla TaxID=7936 RepID=A0A0E9Q380_ANGAN
MHMPYLQIENTDFVFFFFSLYFLFLPKKFCPKFSRSTFIDPTGGLTTVG